MSISAGCRLKDWVGTAPIFQNAKGNTKHLSFLSLVLFLGKHFREALAPWWNGKLPYFLDCLYHLAERKSLASKVSYFDRVFLTKDPLKRGNFWASNKIIRKICCFIFAFFVIINTKVRLISWRKKSQYKLENIWNQKMQL